MNSYKQTIESHLAFFLQTHYPSLNLDVVVHDATLKGFHYQTPLALQLKKIDTTFSPQGLVDFLKHTFPGFYQNLSISGPGFVSVEVHLTPLFAKSLTPKSVVVDYCGVNVAKKMHIGHIRSMFIGDYIAKLHEYQGDTVHRVNHVGDWGNQFGFLLAYLLKYPPPSLTNQTLTEAYKTAYALYQKDAEFAALSHQTAQKLQQKDEELLSLWSHVVSLSLKEAGDTFEELGLSMTLDHTQGESFYAPFCSDLLQKLIDLNIASRSETGAVAVFFEDKPPLVLQKSNGNYLYALYDLAALEWRSKHWSPDKMVYVVDQRQALHFEQVFEVAKKAGLVLPQTTLINVGFGTILGADKKPLKTKSGESLYLDELLLQGKTILQKDPHFTNLEPSLRNSLLHQTIVGGLKYYDLKFSKTQNYTFDWTHVLNFKGGSAPYLQNASVRIDSILFKKYGALSPPQLSLDFQYAWNDMEKALILKTQKTEDYLWDTSYTSQLLCTHAMELCQLFHQYYETHPILGALDEEAKLSLLDFIQTTLQKISKILGIDTYPCLNRMMLTHEKASRA